LVHDDSRARTPRSRNARVGGSLQERARVSSRQTAGSPCGGGNPFVRCRERVLHRSRQHRRNARLAPRRWASSIGEPDRSSPCGAGSPCPSGQVRDAETADPCRARPRFEQFRTASGARARGRSLYLEREADPIGHCHSGDSPDAVREQRLQSPTIQRESELPSLRIVLQRNMSSQGLLGEKGGLTASVD